jgi:hypothetical protein
MSSPDLAIAHIAASQNQKEVTANAAFDQLDSSVNGLLQVAMGDADQTAIFIATASPPLPASATNFTAFGQFECTGALTADRHIIVPNTMRRFVVNNKTTGGHNVVVKTAGSGGTVAVAAGTPQLVYCDGANNIVAVS